MVFIKNSIKRKKVRTISKYSSTIEYNITTKLDAKGLTQLQNQIREVEASLSRLATKRDSDPFNFSESVQQLQKLNKALSSSFDSSLGMLNISKLKTELKDAGVTASQLGQAFSQGGAQGKIAFNNLLGQIGKIDTGLKRTSTTVDKMFNTISNTVRWGIVSSGFSAMLNSLHQSVDYVKELDDSLTQIMLVTDYSRQQMQEYAKSANEAAKSLGATTVDVTRGSQVFAQQGFDLQQSSQLAELSIKLANASEQDSATTSDQITALMNAYGLEGNISDLSKALDSWALVANISAADVQELAKASQKAASSASTVGVSLDQMNAQIATIESVTRDAPEQIGNGLKTLYARMSDIALGETLEDGVDLGKVTGVLQSIGVQVLDQAGQMRNVGDIMEDLMVIWDDLDKTSKEAAGQALAGKYQLNRFYALMDNSDMYRQFKEGSSGASGTLDQMNQEYIDSMAGRMAKFQATLEGLFNSVFNPDNFYPAIDALTNFVDLINKLVDSIGGGQTVLTGIIALFSRLFSNNIAQSINDTMMNRRMDQVRQENAKNTPALLAELGLAGANENNQQIIDFAQYMQANQGSMSKEQVENANKVLEENIAATNRWEQALDNVEAEAQQINFLLGHAYDEPTKVMKDANGQWNFDAALTELQGLDRLDGAGAVKKWNAELDTLQDKLFKIAEARDTAFDLNTSTLGVEQAFQKIKVGASEAQFSLDNLRSVLNPEDYMALKQALDTVQQELMEGAPVADEEAESLMNAALAVDELSKRLQGLTFTRDDVRTVTGRATKTLSEANIAQGGKQASDNILSAYQENFDSQKYIKNIVDTTAAIGELAFAWQSFQNLGSLWRNEDLSIGEKVLQTIMNLSMTIPQLVTAFNTLKQGNVLSAISNIFTISDSSLIDTFTTKISELENLSNQGVTAYDKLIEHISSGGGMNAYAQHLESISKTGEKATKELNKLKNAAPGVEKGMAMVGVATENLAQKAASLPGPLSLIKNGFSALKGVIVAHPFLAVASAIGVAALAFTNYIEAVEETRQKNKETFDSLKQESNDLNNQINDFNKLYESFKETHEVSDELKESAKQLGQHLGIVGTDAMIAANNFDGLKRAIEGANDANLDKLISSAKQVRKDSLGTEWWEKGAHGSSLAREASQAGIRLVRGDLITGAGKVTDEDIKRIIGSTVAKDETDDVEIIAEMEKRLQLLQDYQTKHSETSEEEKRTQEWKNTNDEIQHAIDLTQEFLNSEKVVNAKEGQQSELEARSQKLSFQKQFEGMSSSEEILETLSKDEDNYVSSFFGNTTVSELEKIQKALEIITDDSAHAALGIEQVELSLKEQGKEIDFDEYLKNITDPNKKLEIVGKLDTDKTKVEIEAQLRELSEDESLAIETNIRPKDKQKDIQEDLKISDEKYDILKSNLIDENENLQALSQEAEAYEQNKDSIERRNEALRKANEASIDQNKELEKQNESLNKNSTAYEKNQESIIKNNQAIERNNKILKENSSSNRYAKDQLESLENKIIETAAGAEELSKVWEENSKILADGNSNFYERASAIDNLIPGLSHLLNLDPSVLRTMNEDFFTSTQNLHDMEAAINGDVEALQRLRGAAAEQILIQAGVDPNSNLYGEMVDLINYANAYLPTIEAGATIDDTLFQEMLRNMVKSMIAAGMDIESIMSTLTSLGIEMVPDGSTQMRIPTPEVQARVDQGVFTAMHDRDSGTAGMSGSAIRTELTMHYETIDVDSYKFRKTSGGKGFNGGASYTPKSSGGGGGGSCFVAGTLITMQNFQKPIENIKVGDIVLSYNEEFKRNEYSEVLQTMIHDTTEKIYTLYIKNDKLRVTGIHRFFVTRNTKTQWICAAQLQTNDFVLFADGTKHRIEKIEIQIETQRVYNFEVSNNHNYYVGKNGILAHNKGGSGGSGGGSGKSYEPKEKDPIKEEVDLYEKVNTQLDKVEGTLKGIQQETDRLIGPVGRANLNKQIKLLEKEIDLQKQKLAIQQKERNDLQKQLKRDFNVHFDKEGFITDYQQVLKRLEGDVNKLTKEYNSATTEEAQAQLEKQIEEAKKKLEEFKKTYARYDQLQGKEIQETLNGLEDLQDKIEDIAISAYKASQQAIDDLKELRDQSAELLGLWSKYKTDSPFRAAIVDAEKLKSVFGGTKKEAQDYYQAIVDTNRQRALTATDEDQRKAFQMQADYFAGLRDNTQGGGALELASQDLARLQKWVNNPTAKDNPFGKNTAALYEAYEDAYKRLYDLSLDAEKRWEQLEKDIIDGYDDIAEREEEQIDRYDRITDKLEQIADMTNLVYGDAQYDKLNQIYNQIGQTGLRQARDQVQIVKYWKDRYDAIADKTSDIAKAVKGHLEEAEDKLLDMQKNIADAFQKSFENAIKEITAKTNQRLFGARNLDDVSSDWERDKDYSDRYYDNVQKAARVDQLRAKYLDLLDDAQNSSLAIQNKIRNAMNEQVKYLQEQEHLSEYNVKYANAQLEILQKQIALEDARNNKNQMRLRRDTQGNYRYVYAANQDNIRNREQDLLQSQMDAYDMSKQNRMDTSQEAFNLYRTTMEQLEALNQRIREGDEEAIKAKEQLLEDFERDMKAYAEEIGDSWEGMVESIEWMAETGTDAVKDSVSAALDAIRDQNDEVLTDMGIKGNELITETIEDVDNLLAAVTDASNEMNQQAIDYRTLIENEVAPIVEKGYQDINTAIQDATTSTQDLAKATEELNKALMGDNAQLVEATKKLEEYRAQLDSTKNSSAVTAQQLRQAQADLDRTKAQSLNYKTIAESVIAGSFNKGQVITLKKGTWVSYSRDEIQQDKQGKKGMRLGQDTTVMIHNPNEQPVNGHPVLHGVAVYKNGETPISDNDGTRSRASQMWHLSLDEIRNSIRLDTGGYTGKWSDGIPEVKNGKMAFLHQKELILNASDTENILTTVKMVRDMTNLIKGFGNANLPKGTGFNKLGESTVKQRVEIKAEFPNVQDSNEIKNALLSLSDSAYQYSYRTI